MAFRISKNEKVNFATPQEMFQDNKMKNIFGLIDYQSKTIDNYMKTIKQDGSIINKHVAFELPTGSGKTLIGLLIAEFHRKKFHRKALFLCPTNQLVMQVCKQAKDQYGIETIAFCGKQAEYEPKNKSDFILSKKIGVTTYSSFFATSKYFDATDIIIFDDVHSSENYIAENWSINIQKDQNEILYNELTEVINETVGDSFYSRMIAENPQDGDIAEWCNMLPMPMIYEKLDEIRDIISANVRETSLNYAWSQISDHLGECNIFVSWDSILIRPYIIPTLTFPPFKNAKQCVFMSATLGKSGELERITGVDKIKFLPMVSDLDMKGIGRKYFVFPDLSFSESMHKNLIINLHHLSKKSVVIVPNNNEQDTLIEFVNSESPNTKTFKADDLKNLRDDFDSSPDAMVSISNRFDGIDFPDDSSRMLILYNIPKITHLQERFLYSRMAASVLFSERIKTRIMQAVGRCTRNAKDYAVVCVMGNTVLNELVNETNLKQYAPEMRAEIQFGIDNSTNLVNISEILENVKLFLARDSSWEGAEKHIVELRDEYILEDKNKDLQIFDKLHAAAMKEVELQYCLWKKDYMKSFNIITEIISLLDAPVLRGYKSFWQYCGGNIGKIIGNEYEKKAVQLFQEASDNVLGVSWLAQLANYKYDDSQQMENNLFAFNIERMEKNLAMYRNSKKFESEMTMSLEGLNSSRGEDFENYQQKLGEILGYLSVNPNNSTAPDPYWIVNDDLCVVFEDKIYDDASKKIPVSDISQANRHETWIRENVKNLHHDADIITCFLTNSRSIEEDAKIHANNLYYCNKTEFVDWANKAINCLRNSYAAFTTEGDSEWRLLAEKYFDEGFSNPINFVQMIKTTLLKSI